MTKEGSSARFWKKMHSERMAPADDAATLCGLFVVTNNATELTIKAEPVRVGGRLSGAMPG